LFVWVFSEAILKISSCLPDVITIAFTTIQRWLSWIDFDVVLDMFCWTKGVKKENGKNSIWQNLCNDFRLQEFIQSGN
jgi:hypothetical protein